MAYEIFCADWAVAYRASLHESEAYKKAATSWEWPLVLRVTVDPAQGIPRDLAVYLDLWHGECREARVASKEDMESAPYVVSADAYTWRQVLDKKMEPISGIMRGKIKLVRGSVITLAGYIPAARYLVEAATHIDTRFPGDPT